MRKKIFILIALPILFLSFLFAGERGLTLEEAISTALKNNPDILLAQKEIEASQGRRLQLEARPNPELIFSDEGLGGNSKKGEKEISLGIEQIIEFPGKRAIRQAIGNYGEDISLLKLERIKLIVSAKVEKAYFKASYSQKIVSSLVSVLDILKHYIDLARERYQIGQVPYLDIIRGRLEYLKVLNELVEAKREAKENFISLILIMGKDAPAPVTFLTELSFAPFTKTLSDLKEDIEKSPSLKILSMKQKQTEAELALSRKAQFPDLKIGFFYPSLRPSAWGVEFGLAIPLFLKKQKGEILEAEALNSASVVSVEAKKKRIQPQIEKAYSDLRALEEQVKLFENSFQAEVEDALNAGMASYQYGKIDSLSLLDLYRSYKETKREYLRTLFNYRIALAELQVAAEEEE